MRKILTISLMATALFAADITLYETWVPTGVSTNWVPVSRWATTQEVASAVAPLATAQAIDNATNALVQTYLLTTNAWMSVSNSVLAITIVTNGVTNTVWSSSESAGGLDPSFSNAVYSALASKADTAWGKYTPAGETNPDPDYMTWLNAPATVFAGGCQWAASGTYAALTTAGTVAFAAGSDGQFRIGPNSTNWFGYVQGGSVLIGAVAGAITVTGGGATNGYAEIIYPYESGDFPALWFAPSLAVDFSAVEGVVWVDLTNGTARVTAPATTAAGFWYATTTMSVENYFESTMPAKFSGGVVGNTNAAPVVYDSVIQVQSGNKTYRIPAQEVP